MAARPSHKMPSPAANAALLRVVIVHKAISLRVNAALRTVVTVLKVIVRKGNAALPHAVIVHKVASSIAANQALALSPAMTMRLRPHAMFTKKRPLLLQPAPIGPR